jgi:hypothetical protein
MLSVNLREELESTNQASGLEVDSSENDALVTSLLEGLGIESARIRQQRLEKRQRMMQGVYSERQVQKLCTKYRLRCLPVELFRGKMDEAVPQKKQEFELDFEDAMQQGVNQDNYRIIAPSEMFKLKPAMLDPLLMYQFEVGDTYYYKLVHQWGGNLSWWRAIVNFPMRSIRHLIGCSLLFWAILVTALTLLSGSPGVAGAGSLMGFLATFFTVMVMMDGNGKFKTSDQIWSSERS